MITAVLINGEVSDGTIPITDSSVLRGDACFEVIKAYGGRMLAADAHIDRLAMSSAALEIELPDRNSLSSWLQQIADEVVDGAVRCVVTRGSSVPGVSGESKVIVFGHPWELAEPNVRLHPVVAPWHGAGDDWALAGAKITSYAPNLSSTRAAVSAGFDDALLVSTDGKVLEGPTFSVAWVVDGVLETPTLDLGILDSITRRLVLTEADKLGITVVEGIWELDRLDVATEVMSLSTIREVQPTVAVGDRTWSPGPVTEDLAHAFAELTK